MATKLYEKGFFKVKWLQQTLKRAFPALVECGINHFQVKDVDEAGGGNNTSCSTKPQILWFPKRLSLIPSFHWVTDVS